MRSFAVIALCAIAAGIAFAKTPPARAPIHVGVGRPASGLRGATAPGGSLTVDFDSITVNRDGSAGISIAYTNGSGVRVSNRLIRIDAACTTAVDNLGAVIGTPPAGVCTSLTNIATQFTTLVTNAAGAGKLNL